MPIVKNTTAALWYFLIGITALRFFIAPRFGLGVDEAHYVLYAKHLALSYFDHPPLVGWVQFLFLSIFGDSEFGARVAAILIGFLSSLFIYQLIFAISSNKRIAFYAVLALNASFLFNALFMMLMPDTLLFLWIVPLIFSVIALEKEASLKNWLILGVLLGLSGLSKYTAILFVVPIILYFLIKKEYKLFFDMKMISAVIVALVLISPVLIWNMEHNWISFTYQSEHVSGKEHINILAFLRSIATQFGAYNPFLFIVAFIAQFKSLRSDNSYIFLSGLFGSVLISFFTYNSFYAVALPHWSALFYMLMIPLGTYYFLTSTIFAQKYIKFSLYFGLIISAILYAELAFKFLPLPDYQSLHRDIYGYNKVLKEANKNIKNDKNAALAVTNWTLASRILYYNRAYNSQVFLIDSRYDQFDIWNKESPKGKDLLFINSKFFKFHDNYKCDKIEKIVPLDIMLNNHKVNTFTFTWCYNFQGLK